ncbi:MAG: hypothetical protein FJ313_02220 [Gemmatimonadetes bacterium]|nr:hypothetical protein [Gemmatimonadota bacterium]
MKRETVVLESYDGCWPDEDPDAGFRSMVREYSRLDPLATLENLSRSKNIPLGALVKFILARYSASGAEALLEMGPRVVRQMADVIERAESQNMDRARLEAYQALKAVVSWLNVPITDPGWRPAARRSV